MFPHTQALSGYLLSKRIIFKLLIFDSYPLISKQLVFAFLYASYFVHPVMGKNYDSAMMASGLIGFGMGSTSNAMANMQALSEQYRYSKMAFFVVPIVGALFIDFINIFLIFGFIGFLS